MWKQRIIRTIAIWLIRRSDLFDETYYRKESGINDAVDAAEHYYDGGWRKTEPSLKFRKEDYLTANPDVKVAEVCPLAHYLSYGKFEKRRLAANATNGKYHRHLLSRGIKRFIFEARYCRLIRKNRDVRILVVCHVFYEDACKEILEYIKNLRPYHFDLVVTTVEGRNTEYIQKSFCRFKPNTEVMIYPNRGFDLAPYLATIEKKREKEYDVVMKLQSKRLFDRNGVIAASMYVRGRDWFLYLFESVLGARHVHMNIDRLVNDSTVQLIAAKNLLMKDPDHKRRMTQRKLLQMNLELSDNYTFVAGTCFAMKGVTVREKHLNLLSKCVFEQTERNYFSTAHALERYITGVVPQEAQVGNTVCILRRIASEHKGKEKLRVRGLHVIAESDLKFDDDFVLRFLEYTPVYHYEMIQVSVKDLYIFLEEKKIPLNRCAPYLYLQGEKEQYIEYCLGHRRTDYMELSEEEFVQEVTERGIQRFEKLIEQMDQNGYDEKRPVVIDHKGVILDGQHRACWYMDRYGVESMITVLCLQTEPSSPGNEKFSQRIGG